MDAEMAAASNATVLGLCGNGKARDHCFLRHLACKEYTLLKCCEASVHLEASQAVSILLVSIAFPARIDGASSLPPADVIRLLIAESTRLSRFLLFCTSDGRRGEFQVSIDV
ncbi:hypothetical protein P389DRAFT_42709 [Cystobasidium minutum MCA 4210]|uniref:uncharacterized protein n=1 Tax=Cystobasidium minutum MCA 4210 TaxID=1397322 RepID=UPI0034CEBFAB|eukprot:jgi/Rhomi1/42709/CE42708_108